jgi:hypothetical protein
MALAPRKVISLLRQTSDNVKITEETLAQVPIRDVIQLCQRHDSSVVAQPARNLLAKYNAEIAKQTAAPLLDTLGRLAHRRADLVFKSWPVLDCANISVNQLPDSCTSSTISPLIQVEFLTAGKITTLNQWPFSRQDD